MSSTKHYIGEFEGKKGLTVYVKNNDVNNALRILKKLLQREGSYKESRKIAERFEKPTVKRRRKKAEAKRRWQKYLEKRKESMGF